MHQHRMGWGLQVALRDEGQAGATQEQYMAKPLGKPPAKKPGLGWGGAPMPPPASEEEGPVMQTAPRPAAPAAPAPDRNFGAPRLMAQPQGGGFNAAQPTRNMQGFNRPLMPTGGFGAQIRLGQASGFSPIARQHGPLQAPSSLEGRTVRMANTRPWGRGIKLAQNGDAPAETPPPQEPPPEVPTTPGKAHAWGQLKKADAAELSKTLADLEARAKDANVPPGILTRMRERLDAFIETGAPNAEFSMTEAEINEVNAIINQLEAAEYQASTSTLLWGLVGVGGVTAAVILL